ncbi:MAG: YdcF family protein [Candidatus Yanofskybacteria bacterium]|nr:YdcF family protein [Candidatus Yanofskybacteria bacterium]
MISRELRRFIIIHGEKPYKDCKPHREFLERLEMAIKLASEEVFDAIIVSGGCTRKNCPSEASFGGAFIQSRIDTPILLEEHSHTTVENILFTKELVRNYPLEKLLIVSSEKRLLRLKYLYRRLWPEAYNKIYFVGCRDSYGVYIYILEIIYLIYSIFDVKEHFLPRLAKKFFRNA